jgi:hypothetical protein
MGVFTRIVNRPGSELARMRLQSRQAARDAAVTFLPLVMTRRIVTVSPLRVCVRTSHATSVGAVGLRISSRAVLFHARGVHPSQVVSRRG